MFPTVYSEILTLIDNVDVVAYGKTRNFIQGKVSRLSPYISRGVISLPFVKQRILSRYTIEQSYKFIFELAWREYFQRVWWQMGDGIFQDIKQPQSDVMHYALPEAVVHAETGIDAIDEGIHSLYQTGYLHNHLRMYVASVCCNIGKAHWRQPATWMYYHLLDGDLASNTLGWQWVAGAFSSKKYLCNQENINTYTCSQQRHTFLDTNYEQLAQAKQPSELAPTLPFTESTLLPPSDVISIDSTKPILLYHHYALDPQWRNNTDANRVLLLEPEHFKRFPVSSKVMDFYLALAQNIPGIQVFSGSFNELKKLYPNASFISKAHPAFMHWESTQDEPEWMFPEVQKVSGSFMNFWKQAEKHL